MKKKTPRLFLASLLGGFMLYVSSPEIAEPPKDLEGNQVTAALVNIDSVFTSPNVHFATTRGEAIQLISPVGADGTVTDVQYDERP